MPVNLPVCVPALAALAMAAAGGEFARRISLRSKPAWILSYLASLIVVLLIGLAYRFRTLEFHAPFSWLLQGRTEFLLAPLTAILLGIPLRQLPRAREQRALGILIGFMIIALSVWPLASPAFVRSMLAGLKLRMDPDGVCLQQTEFTCGPAAAVTALKRLGMDATEAEIALAAGSSPAMGTPPDILCATLQSCYGGGPYAFHYRPFHSVGELKPYGPVLAVIKFSLFVDHYVTVFSVDETTVTYGDPLSGKQTVTHAQFAEMWRFVGITIEPKP